MIDPRAFAAICGGVVLACLTVYGFAIGAYTSAHGDDSNWWPYPWLWVVLLVAILAAVVGVKSLTGRDQPPTRAPGKQENREVGVPGPVREQNYILRETERGGVWHIVAVNGRILGTVSNRDGGIRAWAGERLLPGPFVGVDQAAQAIVKADGRDAPRRANMTLPTGHPNKPPRE